MAILIDNQQNRQKIFPENVKKKAKAILDALDSPDSELSIVIVDDSAISKINEQYRGRKGPTNVLAFSMNEGAFAEINPHLLGDVIISTETCLKESLSFDIPFSEYFDKLLIHGILHLFGYDHVNSEKEAKMMEAKEKALLKIISE